MKRIGIGIGIGMMGTLIAMSITGCAADTDATYAGESEIVGVTDLSRLESAWGLKKDSQINGAWQRSDEKLKAGYCYQEKIGAFAKEPQNWEFRRYTTGAAFFRKANTGAASGDKRPIACIDIDSSFSDYTMGIDGFMLDAALRYNLGKPFGSEGAAGHLYVSFGENGDKAVEIRDADHFCGLFAGNPGPEPGLKAFDAELAKCQSSGGADCEMVASNACKWWTTIDAQSDTLDRPAWQNNYVVGLTGVEHFTPQHMMMAYKYALMKGKQSDIFSIGDDPIGKFAKVDVSGTPESFWVAARYEHLDVHQVYKKGDEALYVTPKSSDKKIESSAIAACHRSVDTTGKATSDFKCTGL